MRGMRKNRRSEYKNWVKWGFVPKLGVTLLAALIILSLASCKNAADSGGGSSGNGTGAPSVERDADGKGGSLPLVVYTFKNDDGNDLGTALLRGEQSFGEIKSKVADVSVVESVPGFRGWVVDGDTTLIKNEDKYSSETTFVATYSASASSVIYTFKNSDGATLGTTILRGEQSFSEIKSKVADVSVVESVTGFLGWVVDGDTTLIKNENKYSSETTFVATYEKYRPIDVPDLCDSYVWYSEKDKTYVVFDDSMGMGGLYSVLNKVTSSKEAKDTILDYALLQRALENAEKDWKKKHPGTLLGLNNDPDVKKAQNDLAKFETDNFTSTGFMWWVSDGTTFGMMTADFDTSMYSLHLDLIGKTIVNDAGDVLFTRIN